MCLLVPGFIHSLFIIQCSYHLLGSLLHCKPRKTLEHFFYKGTPSSLRSPREKEHQNGISEWEQATGRKGERDLFCRTRGWHIHTPQGRPASWRPSEKLINSLRWQAELHLPQWKPMFVSENLELTGWDAPTAQKFNAVKPLFFKTFKVIDVWLPRSSWVI